LSSALHAFSRVSRLGGWGGTVVGNTRVDLLLVYSAHRNTARFCDEMCLFQYETAVRLTVVLVVHPLIMSSC